MTGTSINLIKLGMQMSGLLDKKIDVNVHESHSLDPEVLAALQQVGQKLLESGQTLELGEDGAYAVKDDLKQSDVPDHK